MMGAWGCWVGDQSTGIGQSWVLGKGLTKSYNQLVSDDGPLVGQLR
jgi:hypothetical protein